MKKSIASLVLLSVISSQSNAMSVDELKACAQGDIAKIQTATSAKDLSTISMNLPSTLVSFLDGSTGTKEAEVIKARNFVAGASSCQQVEAYLSKESAREIQRIQKINPMNARSPDDMVLGIIFSPNSLKNVGPKFRKTLVEEGYSGVATTLKPKHSFTIISVIGAGLSPIFGGKRTSLFPAVSDKMELELDRKADADPSFDFKKEYAKAEARLTADQVEDQLLQSAKDDLIANVRMILK